MPINSQLPAPEEGLPWIVPPSPLAFLCCGQIPVLAPEIEGIDPDGDGETHTRVTGMVLLGEEEEGALLVEDKKVERKAA